MSIFDNPAEDPFGLFESWMDDAVRSEVNDPNAMALATADKDALPNVRMVLLKGVDARGFVFYTNLESQKGVSFKTTLRRLCVFIGRACNVRCACAGR